MSRLFLFASKKSPRLDFCVCLCVCLWRRPLAKAHVFLRPCEQGSAAVKTCWLKESKIRSINILTGTCRTFSAQFCTFVSVHLLSPPTLPTRHPSPAHPHPLPTCGFFSLGHACDNLHPVSLWNPWINYRMLRIAFGWIRLLLKTISLM